MLALMTVLFWALGELAFLSAKKPRAPPGLSALGRCDLLSGDDGSAKIEPPDGPRHRGKDLGLRVEERADGSVRGRHRAVELEAVPVKFRAEDKVRGHHVFEADAGGPS